MYKVQGSDGKEYGPVSVDLLRQWVSERRVTGQTLVQPVGATDWRPVSSIPELAVLAGSPVSGTAMPPLPPTPASTAAFPGVVPRTSGLAVSSLILGILGITTCGISSIVGIVLGSVALVQIKKSRGQLKGEGLAIAGLCVSGLFLLFVPVSAGLFLPALAKAKSRAQQIQCANNMKQVNLGLRMWAGDHGGEFPPDLMSASNQIPSLKVLICPAEKLRDRRDATDWSDLSLIGSSYDYYGAGKNESRPLEIILQCPLHGNTGLADGSVQQGSRGQRPRP
jgi:hypothetical protein